MHRFTSSRVEIARGIHPVLYLKETVDSCTSKKIGMSWDSMDGTWDLTDQLDQGLDPENFVHRKNDVNCKSDG